MNTKYTKMRTNKKNAQFYAICRKSKKQLARIVRNTTKHNKVKELSQEDRKSLEDIQNMRNKIREEAYERRRKNAIERLHKTGKKSPDELKKSLDDLKKEIAAIKTYSIMCGFPKEDKEMIREMLLNEKIDYNILSNDYFYINSTSSATLTKLRKIMPDEVMIWPHKAKAETTQNKAVRRKKKNEVINITINPRKAVKSKKKCLKLKVSADRKKLIKIAA